VLVFTLKSITKCYARPCFNNLGPGSNPSLRQEVHADASQHSGRFAQDPDPQKPECYGPGRNSELFIPII